MEMGQTAKATEHFEVALDLSRTGKNLDSEAKNMKSLGEVNHSQGAYHYALDLYNKALAIVKNTGWIRYNISLTAQVLISLQETRLCRGGFTIVLPKQQM